MSIDTPATTLTLAGISIPIADVQFIVAEKGLSLSGGEMIIWKRNVIVTQSRRIVVKGSPDENAATFRQVIAHCPRAVAIDANGSITLPRITPDANEDPLDILQSALTSAKREYGRQIIKAFAFALLFFALGVVITFLIVAANAANPNKPIGFQVAVFGIVLFVAGVLSSVRGFAMLGRRSYLNRVLGDLITKGELNTTALAATLSAPPPPPPSPVRLVAATLAILAVTLMLCPYIGLIISAIAFACTFRHRTWARRLSIIGLIVSGTVTTVTLLMTFMGLLR